MRYTKKLSIVLLSALVTTAGISIPEAGAGGYGYRLHFGHGYQEGQRGRGQRGRVFIFDRLS